MSLPAPSMIRKKHWFAGEASERCEELTFETSQRIPRTLRRNLILKELQYQETVRDKPILFHSRRSGGLNGKTASLQCNLIPKRREGCSQSICWMASLSPHAGCASDHPQTSLLWMPAQIPSLATSHFNLALGHHVRLELSRPVLRREGELRILVNRKVACARQVS